MRFIENVSQETISMLQRIYKHSKHHRARQRAHCLLLSFQRHTTTELVEIFQVDRITIYHWFHAWESRRLAGLYDQAKQGRPPKCTPEQKAHIGQWAKAFPKNLNKISVLVVEHFGDPRNAGRIGVGPVCYGAKFNHEFSPSAEDQPTWDSGPKAASFSTSFAIMPRPVSGKLPCKRDSPRVACIGCDRRWPAAISIPSRGFGKP